MPRNRQAADGFRNRAAGLCTNPAALLRSRSDDQRIRQSCYMYVRYRAVNVGACGGLLVAKGFVEDVSVLPCRLPPNSTILGSTIAPLMVDGTQCGFCRRQPYDAVPE